MSSKRPRAVQLTPEGLQILTDEIRRRESEIGERITRDRRALWLGLSVGTVDRVLSRKGVDRSTLQLAFMHLRLLWKDEYCIPVSAESETTPDPFTGVIGGMLPYSKTEPTGLEIVFSEQLTPEQVKGTLEALATYFRECGGLGFEVKFDFQAIESGVLVHA